MNTVSETEPDQQRDFFSGLPEVAFDPGSTWGPEGLMSIWRTIFDPRGFGADWQRPTNPNLRNLMGFIGNRVFGANEEDVYDIVSECSMKLVRIHQSFDPGKGSFESWFFGAIVQFAILSARHGANRNLRFDSIEALTESGWEPASIELSPTLVEALGEALNYAEGVAPKYLAGQSLASFRVKACAVRMRLIQRLSYEKIAAALDTTVVNARAMVSRGLIDLVVLLRRDGKKLSDFRQ